MSNTHSLSLTIAAAAVIFSFAAQAQTVSVDSSLPVETAAAVAQPLSIMQRYEPSDAPVRKADTPLQLLVDDSQASQPSSSVPLASAPLAMSDEVGAQPAINTLGPGRFALTVSQSSGARTAR
jgi:hypothetical protein